MSTVSIALAPVRRDTLATVVTAGTLLGVVDGICALLINVFAFHQPSFERTFQAIAAALLGRGAFTGGVTTALLGVAIHLTVAFSWVILYFMAYRAAPWLRRWAQGPSGIARVGPPVGVIVWLAMNFLVFPMTRIHHAPITSMNFEIFLIQHILIVGPLIVATVR